MSAALRSVAELGVVYGGSAGAIVLGADIGTASLSDRNEVGMFDLAGLGTVGRYAVWCHFEDDQLGAVLAWVRANGRPVLALTERSGAEIVGSELSSIGREPLLLIDERGDCSALGDGETRSLLI
jgi:dipeptidase E